MPVYNMRWSGLKFSTQKFLVYSLLLIVVLLAGCIKPASQQSATATPGVSQPTAYTVPPAGGAPVVNSAPTTNAAPAVDPAVEQFVLSRGQTPNGLQIWYSSPLGPDRLQGFSYAGADGLPCAGFLLTSFANNTWTPTNGALICASQAGTVALAGVTFIATTDGAFYTMVFGRVENPTVTAVAVVYSDGTNQPISPSMGGFLLVKPGTLGVNTITAVDMQGNTVIPNIPQSPV